MSNDTLITRAAKLVKIVRLAGEPGHDEVSIRLNCEPNWQEVRIAKMWATAFELAKDEGKATFDLALKLHEAIR
jgi:hypothetical protein